MDFVALVVMLVLITIGGAVALWGFIDAEIRPLFRRLHDAEPPAEKHSYRLMLTGVGLIILGVVIGLVGM